MTLPQVSAILYSVMAINKLTIKEAESAIVVLRDETKTFERYHEDVATYNAAREAFKAKEAQYKDETGGDLSKAMEPIDTKRKELFYDVKSIDRDEVSLNDAVDGFYKDCLRLWSGGIPSDPRDKASGRLSNLTEWDETGIMEKYLLKGWTEGLRGLSGYNDLDTVKKAALKAISDDDLQNSIPSYKPTYRRKLDPEGNIVVGDAPGTLTDIPARSPRVRTQQGSNYFFNQMNNVMVTKGKLLRKNTNEGKKDSQGKKLRGAKFEYKLA